MELMKILKGEYINPHVSIWWYKLDDVKEVADPAMWVKANPNLGKTVTYEVYQQAVEKLSRIRQPETIFWQNVLDCPWRVTHISSPMRKPCRQERDLTGACLVL